MNALAERVRHDILKLKTLELQTGGKIRLCKIEGEPARSIILELNYKTAGDRNYPRTVQTRTIVEINLLSRYPFIEPKATIRSSIVHPNVYESGIICFGGHWLPTEGLDLFVQRIVKLITYDASVVNTSSPANSSACWWYARAQLKYPDAFPTERFTIICAKKTSLSWTNLNIAGGRCD